LQALVSALYLQGEFYDEPLQKEIYWRAKQRGDRLIPIVIDTGASISISGKKSDFVNGINDVDAKEQI
jgi:hypothetical protein